MWTHNGVPASSLGLLAPPKKEIKMGVLADQNYYTNSKGEVVTEEDADQQMQIVAKGAEITKEMAEKYGEFYTAQPEGEDADSDAKADLPKANKADKPASNKGVK